MGAELGVEPAAGHTDQGLSSMGVARKEAPDPLTQPRLGGLWQP